MCLAVPMTIVQLKDDQAGVVELEGVQRTVQLELIEEPQVGDIVIVHAGYAIERLDEAEAEARLQLFDRLAKTYGAATQRPVRLAAPPKEPK